MTGEHGLSLKPCNYAFMKRSVIDNLEHCTVWEILYDHEGLEGWECTGDHYKKLTNPWYRFCRLVFALTPVYQCPFEDMQGPKQHSYILARGELKQYNYSLLIWKCSHFCRTSYRLSSVFVLDTTVSMWADQDKSEDICTPIYLIQVTFSIMAEGEPIKSGGKLEARPDLFLLTNMYYFTLN